MDGSRLDPPPSSLVSWDKASMSVVTRDEKITSNNGNSLSGWARSFNPRVGANLVSKSDWDTLDKNKCASVI